MKSGLGYLFCAVTGWGFGTLWWARWGSRGCYGLCYRSSQSRMVCLERVDESLIESGVFWKQVTEGNDEVTVLAVCQDVESGVFGVVWLTVTFLSLEKLHQTLGGCITDIHLCRCVEHKLELWEAGQHKECHGKSEKHFLVPIFFVIRIFVVVTFQNKDCRVPSCQSMHIHERDQWGGLF